MLSYTQLVGLQGELLDNEEMKYLDKNEFVKTIRNNGVSGEYPKAESFTIFIAKEQDFDSIEIHVV